MAAKTIINFKTMDLSHMTPFGSFLNNVPLGIPVGPNVQQPQKYFATIRILCELVIAL